MPHPLSSHRERGLDLEKVTKEFKSLFGVPAVIIKDEEEKSIETRYATATSYAVLSITSNKRNTPKKRDISIAGITTDVNVLSTIKNLLLDLIKKKEDSNFVYALTSGPAGLGLTSIGRITQKINKQNYTENVNASYSHVCDCLNSNDPCGRLILFQGSPGTGKSYMIKSLISEVKSTFVVVGTNLIGDLSGPQVLPVLLNQFEGDDKSITFILEDADAALTIRTGGNLNKLADVLNLGDGLLGELLDIRLIATTNANKLELDPAILRPGRMCQHLQFEILTPIHAEKVYSGLIKGATHVGIKKNMTLAEIYRLARKDGWVPDEKELPKQGMYL